VLRGISGGRRHRAGPFDARAKLATPQGVKELSIEQMVPGDMLVDGKIPVSRRTVQRDPDFCGHSSPKPGVRASFESSGLGESGISPWPRWGSVFNFATRRFEDCASCWRISGKPYRETTVEAFLKGKP